MKNNTPEQMEFFDRIPVSPAALRSTTQRRVQRAQWWFNRMRQVVRNAPDWEPAPPPKPEPPFLVLPSTPALSGTRRTNAARKTAGGSVL